MERLSPFKLMNTLFLGLAASVAYGALASILVFLLQGTTEFQQFLAAYTTSFKTVISFGLILGTAMAVYRSQHVIPETIEAAFREEQLGLGNYLHYKSRFASQRRSLTFAAQFVVVGFVLFSYCQFPMQGVGESAMLAAACAQYALGVYVGRKLFYAGMMLHSLLGVSLDRNLFKRRELDEIDVYVHAASTLTVIFVYVHVIGYYDGPFLYGSVLGPSIRPLLMLPAFIATPVLLIFTFYPRAVLKRLYSQSIDVEIQHLKASLQDEALSDFEKRSYLLEVDRMSREELRYNLQLTLSDLPIGITILVMVLEPVLSR